MIKPSAVDLLHTVETTLASLSDALAGNSAGQSTVATARGLLRLAAIRVQREGQLLSDDIHALRDLLPGVCRYLAARTDDAESLALSNRIDHTLTLEPRPRGRYADLVSLAEEANTLREALYQALQLLQSRRSSVEHEPAYIKLRARTRDYCARQLEGEATLIEPAFAGQGPRR